MESLQGWAGVAGYPRTGAVRVVLRKCVFYTLCATILEIVCPKFRLYRSHAGCVADDDSSDIRVSYGTSLGWAVPLSDGRKTTPGNTSYLTFPSSTQVIMLRSNLQNIDCMPLCHIQYAKLGTGWMDLH
jgi:hypothetical protein